MRTIIYLSTIVFLYLAMSRSHAGTEMLPGLLCDSIAASQEQDGSLLCAMNFGDHADWLIFSGFTTNQRLEAQPNSMSIVSDILVSPARKYVAISSVGEGHPIIDVVELESLLDNKEPHPFVSINPYPGVVNVDKWEGEKLLINCDTLITDKNQSLITEAKFEVDVATNKITLLSPDPTQLVAHLLSFITSRDKWTTLDALNTLATLQDKTAIPELEKMLAIKKFEEVEIEKAIESTIKALRKPVD